MKWKTSLKLFSCRVVRRVNSSVQTVSRFMCLRVTAIIALDSTRGSVLIRLGSWMQKSVKNSAYLRKLAADDLVGLTSVESS